MRNGHLALHNLLNGIVLSLSCIGTPCTELLLFTFQVYGCDCIYDIMLRVDTELILPEEWLNFMLQVLCV